MLNVAVKPDRNAQIEAFLQSCDLGDYQRDPIPADASFRRYERIHVNDKTFILMDAPPTHEEVEPFCDVTELLRSHNLHAPELFHRDDDVGFLLLEYLGADSFTKHLRANPADEEALYRAAVDILIHLHQHTVKADWLKPYDNQEYLREISIFAEWFLPQANVDVAHDNLLPIWQSILQRATLKQDLAALRDYHADNLLWLPSLDGHQKVGLIDYQDALLGDPAYDLVSLLEDARRDVAPETVSTMLDYYIEQTGENRDEFLLRYAVLGAQRNTKIIGIFHRLNKRDGKAHYLDYLPRVWAHLERDLEHPALKELADWMQPMFASVK